jgi:hypothetical protein
MGRIGEPKREIHIPVPPPATPVEAPEPNREPDREPVVVPVEPEPVPAGSP